MPLRINIPSTKRTKNIATENNNEDRIKSLELMERMVDASIKESLKDPKYREFLRHMPIEYAHDEEMAAQYREIIMDTCGLVVDKDPFPPKYGRNST